jgi:two-component system alkaline phosphatase synthesis response regulator PhoP
MPRIAIIEDDEATRYVFQLMLTEEGYEVIPIKGPGDLLAQLTAAMPDVVLLDLMLGAWGNGLALAMALRTHPQYSTAPLIVMSAAHEALRQHQGKLTELQCHVLEKPFDLDDLRALVMGELLCRRVWSPDRLGSVG